MTGNAKDSVVQYSLANGDHWPTVRIGSVGRVQAGRQRSPHITRGVLRPYLRVANVFDGYIDYSDVLQMLFSESEFEIYALKPGDILLNEGQSLGLVGRSAIYHGPGNAYCYQNTLVRFRPGDTIDGPYAQLVFQHLLIDGVFASIATRTTSIAHLGVERFASLKIPLPSLPEQRAIAAVLSAWDRGIRQTTDLVAAKRRFKQGLMQELLTGKRRFSEFVGLEGTHHTPCGEMPRDWPSQPLREVFREIKRKNDKTTTRVLTASGQHGMVDQRDFFNRSVAGRSLQGYSLLRKGEFAYNRSLMNGYPFGAIKRLDLYDCGAVSTLYLCFALDREDCDADFVVHFFESGLLNLQLRGIAKVGARAHGLLNVAASEFFALSMPLPKPDEQRRIAAVLNALDRDILLQSQLLDILKTQKKGLMQKLLTGEVRVKVAP